MMEGEIVSDSKTLVFEWTVLAVDDEESILADDGGQRAEATCGGYLLVARSWAVSGDASWHVEAGFDQPAGAGKDMPAASLLDAQIAAEAYVLERLAVDPGVARAMMAGVEAAAKARERAADVFTVAEFRRAGFQLGALRDEALAVVQADFEDAVVLLNGLSGSAKATAVRASTMAEVVTTAASLGLSAEELGAAVATLQARDPR